MYYVYIITNKFNNVFCDGVTNNLPRRIYEHRGKITKGFSEKYNVSKLVYFEACDNPMGAIEREKQIKNWHRPWKIDQITKSNAEWNDLYYEILK